MTSAAGSGHMDARMRARRARVHADAVRRRQRRTISLFALLVVVAGVAVVLRSPLFGISGIRVTGVEGPRAAAVERIAALERGQQLLTAPLEDASRRVEGLPWVKQAVVRRAPPSTVAIEVVPRTPLLTLRTDGASWQVDDEAVLVDGGRVRGAPVITVGQMALPELGVPVDDETVQAAVDAHVGIPPWLRRRVTSYDVADPAGLVLHLQVPPRDADGESAGDVAAVRVLVGDADNLALKAEVIRVLLPQAISQGGDLDVRAPANPVVVP